MSDVFRIKENVSGAKLTTLAIGGPLRALIVVDSISSLIRFIKSGTQEKPISVLGAGSNVLISDEGIQGTVIQLGTSFRTVEKISDKGFKIGAGASLMSVARKLSRDGYSGLEFAGGIPGQVGGSVFMNAGAHGGEISSVIKEVSAVSLLSGETSVFQQSDLSWRYRSSGLPASMIVVSAHIELVEGDPHSIANHLTECLEERKKRQPLTLPSCGSVFKNPPNVSAGLLIEKAGLKSFKHGDVQVSDLHANWIVNPEKKGSAKHFIELVEIIKKRVFETSGTLLEEEVRIWRG